MGEIKELVYAKNEDLILELESLLEMARSGELRSMAIFAELTGGDIYHYWDFKHNNLSIFSKIVGHIEIFKQSMIYARFNDKLDE